MWLEPLVVQVGVGGKGDDESGSVTILDTLIHDLS